MNATYKAQTTIHASTDAVWNAIARESFVKDFLPEVKKDISAMGEYIQTTHRNASSVLPSYAVTGRAIGWNTGAGKTIRLPRKDVHANIEAVDIQLESHENDTKVTIEVTYNPKVGKNFMLANRCVRGLFSIKLNVLKQDIEPDYQHTSWLPAFT